METSFDALRTAINRWPPVDTQPSNFDLVLGPCAIESEGQVWACAAAAAQAGARYLRGGAIKLRTFRTSFSGPGPSGWELLGRAARANGLRAVSEVTRPEDVKDAAQHLDAVQIGARSMWQFDLLEACAKSGRPVVLKRGIGATTLEWLAAADRLLGFGCPDVIMCERGIHSVDPAVRNAVDISVLTFLAQECPLKVWLDVSHSAGDPIVAMALLKLAPVLGISGAMAEIHPEPSKAQCDGFQAISLDALRRTYRVGF